MIEQEKILVTGGDGLLANELKLLLPHGQFVDKDVLDVADEAAVQKYFDEHEISLVIHTAALMPPIKAQEDPAQAVSVNIIGTGNITKACINKNIKLIYISTDYVFKGDKGNYIETDELSPVNEYAWSKLGGECCLQLYKNSLIVRTSFGAKEFPHPKAFSDQYTSKERVDVIAKKIVSLLDKDITGVIHLGGPRRTVFEYAKSLPNTEKVEPMKREDLKTGYVLPKDTSLDTTKFERISS